MKKRNVAERFWEKVDMRGDDECWVWTAAIQRGYGAFRIIKDGVRSQVNAHRVAYELANGPIPDGMHVLHSCDNPPCCNPNHLRAGSRSENMREAHERGRVRYENRNSHRLTEAEKKGIIDRLVCGGSVRGISREFGIAPQTVRRYRSDLESVGGA